MILLSGLLCYPLGCLNRWQQKRNNKLTTWRLQRGHNFWYPDSHNKCFKITCHPRQKLLKTWSKSTKVACFDLLAQKFVTPLRQNRRESLVHSSSSICPSLGFHVSDPFWFSVSENNGSEFRRFLGSAQRAVIACRWVSRSTTIGKCTRFRGTGSMRTVWLEQLYSKQATGSDYHALNSYRSHS